MRHCFWMACPGLTTLPSGKVRSAWNFSESVQPRGVGLAVGVAVGVSVSVLVGPGVGVSCGVGLIVSVGRRVAVGVTVGEGVGEGVSVRVGVNVGLGPRGAMKGVGVEVGPQALNNKNNVIIPITARDTQYVLCIAYPVRFAEIARG